MASPSSTFISSISSNFKVIILLSLWAGSASAGIFSWLYDDEQTQRNDAKSLTVVEKSKLEVSIEPVKASFRVNEKIRFRAKGNQPYYLYLFNVDPETDQAMMILPNPLQTDNRYERYSYIVPNRNIEFYGDRPGIEQIIMIASTRPLPVPAEQFKTADHFITGKSSEFEKSLGILFRDSRSRNSSPDILIKSFDIQIEEITSSPEPSSQDNTTVFVSTADKEYYEGDRFELVFGADRPGFVHLYSIEPNGAYDLLNIARVDGKSIQSVTLQAGAPYGQHTLVAIFNTSEQSNHRSIEALTLDRNKTLYLMPPSRKAIATHQITINPLNSD